MGQGKIWNLENFLEKIRESFLVLSIETTPIIDGKLVQIVWLVNYLIKQIFVYFIYIIVKPFKGYLLKTIRMDVLHQYTANKPVDHVVINGMPFTFNAKRLNELRIIKHSFVYAVLHDFIEPSHRTF